jgi:hypothetical protein
MSGVFAQIPMSGNSQEQIGPDPQKMMQMQQQALQIQQQRAAAVKANALNDILKQPDAIDAKTGIPTANAMKQIMGIDPQTGMAITQNSAKMQQVQLQQDAQKTAQFAKKRDLMGEAADAGIIAEETAAKQGLPREAQLAAAQEAVNTHRAAMASSGAFSPEEMTQIPTKYDPVQFRAFTGNLKDFRAGQKQDTTETRQDSAAAERERHDRATEAAGKAPKPPTPAQQKWDMQMSEGNDKIAKENEERSKTGRPPMTPAEEAHTRLGVVSSEAPGQNTPAALRMREANIISDAEIKDKNRELIAAGKPPMSATDEAKVHLRDQAEAQNPPPSAELQEANAKQIANYEMPAPTGYALYRPGTSGLTVMQMVTKLNPDFDGTRFSERQKAVKDFGTGPDGKTVRSLDVGTTHLANQEDLARALQNGDMQAVNSAGQRIAQELGVPAPTNFDAAKQIVGDEIVKAIVGYNGASADREKLQESLNRASSPAQLSGVISTFRTLMAGQLQGLKRQYETSTGIKEGPFAFDNKLGPETLRTIGAESAAAARNPRDTNTAGAPPAKAETSEVHQNFTKEQYDAAPPGTHYTMPGDPTVRTKQGGGAAPAKTEAPPPAQTGPAKTAAPKAGDAMDGWIFNGGDPADPKNWRKAPGQ